MKKKKDNKCNRCGQPIDWEDFDSSKEIPKRMKMEHICYRCAFWRARSIYDCHLKIENKIALITPDYSHWVAPINGKIITVPDSFSGIYHTQIYPIYTIGVIFEYDKKVSIIRINSLPHQGTIPEHLRDLFKPNAIFLTPEQAKFLEDYQGNAYEYIKNLIDNFDK